MSKRFLLVLFSFFFLTCFSLDTAGTVSAKDVELAPPVKNDKALPSMPVKRLPWLLLKAFARTDWKRIK
jgi:hypothetical protein